MANRVLSVEEAREVWQHARSRGDYLVQLQKFVDSGELGWDFTEIFGAKEASTIRTSLNNNIDKHSKELNWPMLKVVVNTDKETKQETCIVVNMVAYSLVADGNATVTEETVTA